MTPCSSKCKIMLRISSETDKCVVSGLNVITYNMIEYILKSFPSLSCYKLIKLLISSCEANKLAD